MAKELVDPQLQVPRRQVGRVDNLIGPALQFGQQLPFQFDPIQEPALGCQWVRTAGFLVAGNQGNVVSVQKQ